MTPDASSPPADDRAAIQLALRPYAFDPRRLVCRRCGFKVSLSFIYTLLDESINGAARCFCGGTEWDGLP